MNNSLNFKVQNFDSRINVRWLTSHHLYETTNILTLLYKNFILMVVPRKAGH